MSKFTPGYRVTDDGRVFSIDSNWRGYGEREMQQAPNASGYPSVRILVNGRRLHIAVHKLVAAEFLPEKPSHQHEIRHLDGDKTNNNASNLAWGTRKENADDRELHGRTSRGELHARAIRAAMPAISPNKGRRLSDAHRKNLGNAMRGKPWSAARRASSVK